MRAKIQKSRFLVEKYLQAKLDKMAAIAKAWKIYLTDSVEQAEFFDCEEFRSTNSNFGVVRVCGMRVLMNFFCAL